ncbi:hypothetical protein ACG2K1_02195 [Neisseria sp. 23W00296]|uniref:hypothetical protein n=1 Tax=unclassified Neisseria TaxID=2623750 RepID=UPI003757A835
MFRKLFRHPALLRCLPLSIGLSMYAALFYGMSFALWGPDSHRNLSLALMLLSALLTAVLALNDKPAQR